MGETILIAVKSHNQIEEIIPRLKNTVKAGTRVVFLIRYSVSSLPLFCLNYVEVLQPGASASLAARYSFPGTQAQLAEHRISGAFQILSSNGIDANVHFYTGSLRKAARKFTAREKDVQLVVVETGGGCRSKFILERFLPLSHFFKKTPYLASTGVSFARSSLAMRSRWILWKG